MNNAIDPQTTESAVDSRQRRGLLIAAICPIKKSHLGEWLVPSQSGKGKYRVHVGDQPSCTCPDHETRGCKCKHIFAVEYAIKREQNADGSTTVTETLSVSRKRKTYSQDWPAYNEAQVNEKREFLRLLHDLCRNIPNAPQTKGRPRLDLSDAVFAVAFKIYSTFSGRRFISDLCDAQEKGYIKRVPHFNSIFNYLENPELTPILMDLIITASLPLNAVESDFAVDSTGFTTSRFYKWFDHKYGVERLEHDWVKTHCMTGVKTNVVTAVEILTPTTADAPQLPALVETTAQNFAMVEVSADKAYSSVVNLSVIEKHGAAPFIPFKSNATPAKGGIWEKMYHFFSFKKDEFCAHYHKRSNIETTFMMIKSKFRDHVRSKTDIAMKNEVLCKILCHNICCLISAMYELEIDIPSFGSVGQFV